jgi:hypothetical protein
LEGALLYEASLSQHPVGSLRRRDLENCAGAVEGAVERITGKDCDHACHAPDRRTVEAVVQLRCVEIAGQWYDFDGNSTRISCGTDRTPVHSRAHKATPRPIASSRK